MTGPGSEDPTEPQDPVRPTEPTEPIEPVDRSEPGPDEPDEPNEPTYVVEPSPRGCRCCLLVLGGALFFIAPFALVTVFILSMSSSPDDSVRAWLDAVRQGRYSSAVHQMCSHYRGSLAPDDLRRRVSGAGGITRGEIGMTSTRSKNAASVRVTLTGTDGKDRRVTLSVIRDGELWRVCSLP